MAYDPRAVKPDKPKVNTETVVKIPETPAQSSGGRTDFGKLYAEPTISAEEQEAVAASKLGQSIAQFGQASANAATRWFIEGKDQYYLTKYEEQLAAAEIARQKGEPFEFDGTSWLDLNDGETWWTVHEKIHESYLNSVSTKNGKAIANQKYLELMKTRNKNAEQAVSDIETRLQTRRLDLIEQNPSANPALLYQIISKDSEIQHLSSLLNNAYDPSDSNVHERANLNWRSSMVELEQNASNYNVELGQGKIKVAIDDLTHNLTQAAPEIAQAAEGQTGDDGLGLLHSVFGHAYGENNNFLSRIGVIESGDGVVVAGDSLWAKFISGGATDENVREIFEVYLSERILDQQEISRPNVREDHMAVIHAQQQAFELVTANPTTANTIRSMYQTVRTTINQNRINTQNVEYAANQDLNHSKKLKDITGKDLTDSPPPPETMEPTAQARQNFARSSITTNITEHVQNNPNFTSQPGKAIKGLVKKAADYTFGTIDSDGFATPAGDINLLARVLGVTKEKLIDNGWYIETDKGYLPTIDAENVLKSIRQDMLDEVFEKVYPNFSLALKQSDSFKKPLDTEIEDIDFDEALSEKLSILKKQFRIFYDQELDDDNLLYRVGLLSDDRAATGFTDWGMTPEQSTETVGIIRKALEDTKSDIQRSIAAINRGIDVPRWVKSLASGETSAQDLVKLENGSPNAVAFGESVNHLVEEHSKWVRGTYTLQLDKALEDLYQEDWWKALSPEDKTLVQGQFVGGLVRRWNQATMYGTIASSVYETGIVSERAEEGKELLSQEEILGHLSKLTHSDQITSMENLASSYQHYIDDDGKLTKKGLLQFSSMVGYLVQPDKEIGIQEKQQFQANVEGLLTLVTTADDSPRGDQLRKTGFMLLWSLLSAADVRANKGIFGRLYRMAGENEGFMVGSPVVRNPTHNIDGWTAITSETMSHFVSTGTNLQWSAGDNLLTHWLNAGESTTHDGLYLVRDIINNFEILDPNIDEETRLELVGDMLSSVDAHGTAIGRLFGVAYAPMLSNDNVRNYSGRILRSAMPFRSYSSEGNRTRMDNPRNMEDNLSRLVSVEEYDQNTTSHNLVSAALNVSLLGSSGEQQALMSGERKDNFRDVSIAALNNLAKRNYQDYFIVPEQLATAWNSMEDTGLQINAGDRIALTGRGKSLESMLIMGLNIDWDKMTRETYDVMHGVFNATFNTIYEEERSRRFTNAATVYWSRNRNTRSFGNGTDAKTNMASLLEMMDIMAENDKEPVRRGRYNSDGALYDPEIMPNYEGTAPRGHNNYSGFTMRNGIGLSSGSKPIEIGSENRRLSNTHQQDNAQRYLWARPSTSRDSAAFSVQRADLFVRYTNDLADGSWFYIDTPEDKIHLQLSDQEKQAIHEYAKTDVTNIVFFNEVMSNPIYGYARLLEELNTEEGPLGKTTGKRGPDTFYNTSGEGKATGAWTPVLFGTSDELPRYTINYSTTEENMGWFHPNKFHTVNFSRPFREDGTTYTFDFPVSANLINLSDPLKITQELELLEQKYPGQLFDPDNWWRLGTEEYGVTGRKKTTQKQDQELRRRGSRMRSFMGG
jgi:hypothetical protein